MKRFFTILILLYCTSSICSATTIVIFIINNEIYVGSDSRRTIYTINRATQTQETTLDDAYCKIHSLNKVYFAIAGFADNVSLELANESILKSKSFDDAIQIYSLLMKKSWRN